MSALSQYLNIVGGLDMARDRKIDVVILGLLSHEDLTGYDIKKRIDGAIGFFWKGSFGNIYPALTSMVEQGLVTKNGEKAGGREKIFYHITKKGEDQLKSWLKDDHATNELRYETLLKIYFGGAGDSKITLRNIQVFEEQIKRSLEVLYLYRDNLKDALKDEDHKYYYLTVTFGIDTYEAYLKWCAKAKKLITHNDISM
jgi:DNA-binding PadR family transcriptional regulator